MAKKKKSKAQDKTTPENTKASYSQAGFFRRLAALIYDFLLNLGIWMVTTGIYIAVFVSITDEPPGESLILQLTLFPLLFASTFFFYAWFWTHGGKTLGMQAWRLRAVTSDGNPMTIKDCLMRTIAAIPLISLFGIGLLWVLLDRENTALHDHLSKTRVIYIPKES